MVFHQKLAGRHWAIALIVLVNVWWLSQIVPIGLCQVPDSAAYQYLINDIPLGEQLFSVSTCPPGFPVLLWLIHTVSFGQLAPAYLVVNSLLFLSSLVLLYLIIEKVSRSTWLAFGITLFLSFNLPVTQLVNFLIPEILSLFFLHLIVWLLVNQRAWQKNTKVRTLFALLAILSLTKPLFLYLPALLLCLFWHELWLIHRASTGKTFMEVIKVKSKNFIIYGVYYLIALLAWTGVVALLSSHKVFTGVYAINLVGKIMQYDLVELAPNEFAAVKTILASPRETWNVYEYLPSIAAVTPPGQSHFAHLNAFAMSIITRHPFIYLKLSLLELPEVVGSYLFNDIELYFVHCVENISSAVLALNDLYQTTHGWFTATSWYWAVANLIFTGQYLLRPKAYQRKWQALFMVSLIVWYTLVVIALGAYSEYTRIKTPVALLMITAFLLSPLALLSDLRQLLAKVLKTVR